MDRWVCLPPRCLVAVGAALLLLATGCGGSHAEVRGRPPTGPVLTVARLAAAPANGTVTVRGTMVEK